MSENQAPITFQRSATNAARVHVTRGDTYLGVAIRNDNANSSSPRSGAAVTRWTAKTIRGAVVAICDTRREAGEALAWAYDHKA